jgi:DNA-binding MarR family transcriptional regulator
MPRKPLKRRGEGSGLPTETAQARRFGKARSAQSTALLEDYVELIDDLLGSAGEARPTDIARRLGVSHATAIKAIARLKREGLATARPYRGVFLTQSGQALAARVRSFSTGARSDGARSPAGRQRTRRTRHQHHIVAGLSKAARELEPDTAACAGDQRGLAVAPAGGRHAPSSFLARTESIRIERCKVAHASQRGRWFRRPD